MLERVVDEQWNVLRLDQLRAAGLTHRQIESLVRRRLLHRRHRRVYTYGHPRIPWQGVLLAAQFACGPSVWLTGETALALHGLRNRYLGEIHVRTVGSVSRISDPTIRLHRTRVPLTRAELRMLGPISFAAIPRLLLDLGRTKKVSQLTDLITDAIRRGKLDHDAMLSALDRHRGQPGVKKLAAAYAYYLPRPDSKSGLERDFDRIAATRAAIPQPERNIHIEAGGVSWEVDRYYARERVALELDGRNFHTAERDRERDEVKNAKLAMIGILVTRITDARWNYDRDGALADFEAILAERRGLAGEGV